MLKNSILRPTLAANSPHFLPFSQQIRRIIVNYAIEGEGVIDEMHTFIETKKVRVPWKIQI
jgi:hypothetical protein